MVGGREGELGGQEKEAKAERAHLILKGFMRHFPFILTTKKDARLQWPGEKGAGKEVRGQGKPTVGRTQRRARLNERMGNFSRCR